ASAVAGELAGGGGPVEGTDVQLVFAGGVREVRDGAPVGGERRRVLAHALGLGEVADGTLLGGNGEQLAARFQEGAAPCRREVEGGDVPPHVLEVGDGTRPVTSHLDVQGLRAPAREVE